jgi:hypothetical protein
VNKPILLALGLVAVTIAACGGKVVVESSGAAGTGGAGGTPSSFTTADGAPDPSTNVAVVGVSAVASTSATTGTGTSDCDPTYTCAEAITTPEGDPTKFCDNTLSYKVYYGLMQCLCVDKYKCAVQCAASACAGLMPGPTCMLCLQDTVNGCGASFADCSNN